MPWHSSCTSLRSFAIVQFSRRAMPPPIPPFVTSCFAIVQFSRRAMLEDASRHRPALLPKLQLLWKPSWNNLFCRSPLYCIHSFPLCASHEKRTHRPFRRHIQFQPSQMGLLSRKRDTRPCIHRELNHVITVIQKEFSKLRRIPPLPFRPDRQVEAHHQPTHFEFLRIHGLYSDSFPLISAFLKPLMTDSKTASRDNSSF